MTPWGPHRQQSRLGNMLLVLISHYTRETQPLEAISPNPPSDGLPIRNDTVPYWHSYTRFSHLVWDQWVLRCFDQYPNGHISALKWLIQTADHNPKELSLGVQGEVLPPI